MKAEDLGKTQEAWDQIAGGYDQFVTPTHLWVAKQGLTRVGLKPGMNFLDVACGTGALSLIAAKMGAKVTATDISGAMINLLKERSGREGLDLNARVMDGHNLQLDDNTFDVSGSQWGVMLFTDLPKGLAEMVRVTKPGGKVLLHCYGPPQQVEFLNFFIQAIRQVRPEFEGLPEDPVPLPFQVADPETLSQAYFNAGLKEIQIEAVTETLEFKSGQALWDWVLNSNPVPGLILETLQITTAEEDTIKNRLEELICERAGKGGVAKLTNPVHIAIGTV